MSVKGCLQIKTILWKLFRKRKTRKSSIQIFSKRVNPDSVNGVLRHRGCSLWVTCQCCCLPINHFVMELFDWMGVYGWTTQILSALVLYYLQSKFNIPGLMSTCWTKPFTLFMDALLDCRYIFIKTTSQLRGKACLADSAVNTVLCSCSEFSLHL